MALGKRGLCTLDSPWMVASWEGVFGVPSHEIQLNPQSRTKTRGVSPLGPVGKKNEII